MDSIYVVTTSRYLGFTKYQVKKETAKTYQVGKGEPVVKGVGIDYNRTVAKGHGVFLELDDALAFFVANMKERQERLRNDLRNNELLVATALELRK